jgi:hypothetical protein
MNCIIVIVIFKVVGHGVYVFVLSYQVSYSGM